MRIPSASSSSYLALLAREASRRGYVFDITKISTPRLAGKLVETRGQLLFEWKHLKRKLRLRSPQAYRECRGFECPRASSLFRIVNGPVQEWEKAGRARRRRLPDQRRK